MRTFRDVEEEALFFRHTQLTKYTHLYSITLQIPIPASGAVTLLEPVLEVMEDADFHVTHLSGSCVSPVDANGVRIISGSDMSINFAMAGAANRSDRGASFKFLEPATNRRLTEGRITQNAVDLAAQAANPWNHTYVNFGDIFTPGYDYGWGKPVPFDYYLAKGERLKVLIQCTDFAPVDPQCYQRVSMAFIGHRYAA